MASVLITAATPWESRPLAKALGLAASGAGLYRGELSATAVLLLETGMGPARAEAALAALPKTNGGGPPTAVLSAGFAGALQPGLASGDIVADLHGGPPGWIGAARSTASELGAGLHFGAIVTLARVVGDPEEKLRLGRERRAAAVDMESASVRAWASRRGADFASIRAILDTVDMPLPAGAPGGDDPAELARFAFRNLGRLPFLLRLGLLQRRSIGRLGRFLGALLPRLVDPEGGHG